MYIIIDFRFLLFSESKTRKIKTTKQKTTDQMGKLKKEQKEYENC